MIGFSYDIPINDDGKLQEITFY